MNQFVPKRIFIENAVKDLPLTRQILKKCPDIPSCIVPAAREFMQQIKKQIPGEGKGKDTLFLCQNRGRFVEPCPGTKKYICCGYMILNTGVGCPLDCTYCVLQSYLNNPCITVYVNRNDMLTELLSNYALQQQNVMRLGTGEYADSLALEHLTNFIPFILPFLKRRKGLLLELKTKTTHIEPLMALDHGRSIMVSWSLNTEVIAEKEEIGAASVQERIRAAGRLASKGYRIGFHFDPLIYYPGWEKDYHDIVHLLAKSRYYHLL